MHTKNNTQHAYKSVFSECNSLLILHEDLSVDIRKFALGLIMIFLSAIAFSIIRIIVMFAPFNKNNFDVCPVFNKNNCDFWHIFFEV